MTEEHKRELEPTSRQLGMVNSFSYILQERYDIE